MGTQESRGQAPRTTVCEQMSGKERFSRSQSLDRPFLSQSPGYDAQVDVRRDPDLVTSVVEVTAAERRAQAEAGEVSPSVDEIVALLSSKQRNRHYKTGGRPGVFVQHARKVKQRIAGAPIN